MIKLKDMKKLKAGDRIQRTQTGAELEVVKNESGELVCYEVISYENAKEYLVMV